MLKMGRYSAINTVPTMSRFTTRPTIGASTRETTAARRASARNSSPTRSNACSRGLNRPSCSKSACADGSNDAGAPSAADSNARAETSNWRAPGTHFGLKRPRATTSTSASGGPA